ncbi:uncharacterized protein LOC120931600 [Rana temporaria]|uniref:uncharacterized protein LOC120931600 n=1 Tax=Rana temporaria TaxID=8407 RepID=UPI001AADE2A7|nr:uncharacterized protein LOC120931600 [Rana temporaria]
MPIISSRRSLDNKHLDRILLQYLQLLDITIRHCLYMAKFFAELLGCTLRDKGASPTFEIKSQSRISLNQSTKRKTTIFSTLTVEKSLCETKLANVFTEFGHVNLNPGANLLLEMGNKLCSLPMNHVFTG